MSNKLCIEQAEKAFTFTVAFKGVVFGNVRS